MPVPKQRHSRLRQKLGRERFALKPKELQKCPKCSEPVVAHQVCKACGTYRGRIVMTPKVAKPKK